MGHIFIMHVTFFLQLLEIYERKLNFFLGHSLAIQFLFKTHKSLIHVDNDISIDKV